jgi:hypothetical protein
MSCGLELSTSITALAVGLGAVLVLPACTPTVDDDSVGDDDDSVGDDDDDGGKPSLSCDEPEDPPPPVLDCGLQAAVPDDGNWSSFRSPDGEIEVLMVRDWVMQGAGFSAIYELVGFGAVLDGCRVCVDDAALLDYESSHHNWIDVAWLRLEDQELQLETTFQPAGDDPMNEWTWVYSLSGLHPEDREVVLWGPVELDGAGGMIPPA